MRAVDAFVDELDLAELGFERTSAAATGRPGYHPSTMLKIYIYGYLNRIQSSRRMERESRRNLELMWLTERLSPDFKAIADFRKDNGQAIQKVCSQFILLCRQIGMFSGSSVVIDGSKFKAVNSRYQNFTAGKLKARIEQADWHLQITDGLNAFSDEDHSQSQYRDESSCSGIQLEADAGDSWNRQADSGNPDLESDCRIHRQLCSCTVAKNSGLDDASDLIGSFHTASTHC